MKKILVLIGIMIFFSISYSFPDKISISNSKGPKLTSERYFDWNGSGWTIRQTDDFELDSLGNIERMVQYFYDSEGVYTSSKTWACTYSDTSYTISRYTSGWSGKIHWTLLIKYTYDLDGKILSYNNHSDWSDPIGGGSDHYDLYYTYNESKISSIYSYDSYDYGSYNHTLTEFYYDDLGKVMQELTKVCLDIEGTPQIWVDKERTLWTYDGNIGTGINEIYKNTVWIHQNKKIRTLDFENKTIDEERNPWSWGYWLDDEMDQMQYINLGDINRIYTNQYNTETEQYEYYKLHNFYYENFGGMSAPGNFIQTIIGDQLTLSWYAVTGSTGYKVYSSEDPYGIFDEDTTGIFNGNEWTTTISGTKKFYRVTAINEEK